MLYLAGAEGGGFHYRSNSSDGKTTALRVAASVCGGPDFMQRWRATDNGLEALALQHCDAPLLLDELAQIDPRAAGEVAYMLANGGPGGHFKFLHLWPGQIPPVGDDRTGEFYSLAEPFARREAASLRR